MQALEYSPCCGATSLQTAVAARLEQLVSSLAQTVRGPQAERDLEKARKEKRDAESLKIYAGQQRQEVDGTTAAVFRDTRAHIAQSL